MWCTSDGKNAVHSGLRLAHYTDAQDTNTSACYLLKEEARLFGFLMVYIADIIRFPELSLFHGGKDCFTPFQPSVVSLEHHNKLARGD